MVTVVSLGTERGDLTLNGYNAVRSADEVLVRTAAISSAQTLDDLGVRYSTLDFLYESSRNYDTLAKKIAAEVRRRGKEKKVCYCVDGAAAEDAAARLLIGSGAAVVGGRSKASHIAEAARLKGEYTARSAFDLGDGLSLPLVVYDLTLDNVSDVKLRLMDAFGDEVPAFVVSGGECRKVPLFEADRLPLGPLAGLALGELSFLQKGRHDFLDVVRILRRLRAPDGCPWDRVQTHASIRINAIEEAYELVDAVDRDDPERICEEAGDVLMQALFHTLIEEERGNFTVEDMLSGLCEKLITRHTHVFGTDKASGADGALSVWEANKRKEKHQETFSDSVLDVPEAFPALLRAQKVAKRMEKGGWDAATFENFEKKFREEYGELRAACAAGDRGATQEELGDVLFCAVELGRAAGADCETALLDTVAKMQKRYAAYEHAVLADGKDVNALSEEEKAYYYKKAKHV